MPFHVLTELLICSVSFLRLRYYLNYEAAYVLQTFSDMGTNNTFILSFLRVLS